MQFLLHQIQDDINFDSQGKRIKKIKMNSRILRTLIELAEFEVINNDPILFGMMDTS